MKSDLSNVKVGDKIWTIQEGWTEVARTNSSNLFPIETNGECYTIKGAYRLEDKHPSAFLENPFEKEITREVEEKILNGFHTSLYDSGNLDMMLYHVEEYLDQKYKALPTAEEAAEKLGITISQLKEILK